MPEIPYLRQPTEFSSPVRYAYGPDSSRQPDHGVAILPDALRWP